MSQHERSSPLVRESIEQCIDAHVIARWNEGSLSEEGQARREPTLEKAPPLSFATREAKRDSRSYAISPAFQAGICPEAGSRPQDLEQRHLCRVVCVGVGSAEKPRETPHPS
jgi:hypothetical protein